MQQRVPALLLGTHGFPLQLHAEILVPVGDRGQACRLPALPPPQPQGSGLSGPQSPSLTTYSQAGHRVGGPAGAPCFPVLTPHRTPCGLMFESVAKTGQRAPGVGHSTYEERRRARPQGLGSEAVNTETVWCQEGQVTGDKPGYGLAFPSVSLLHNSVPSTWQAHNHPGANPGAHMCCARCPGGHRNVLIRNLLLT